MIRAEQHKKNKEVSMRAPTGSNFFFRENKSVKDTY